MKLWTQLEPVRQQWWLVLVMVTLALGVGGFVTVRTQPHYAADVTFFVTTLNSRVGEAYQGDLFVQQRVKSYRDLLTSDRLAGEIVAAESHGLTAEQVRTRISATIRADTVVINATVTDPDQARALGLTRTLADRFVRLVSEIETPPGAQSPPIRVEVVSGPRVSTRPVSPDPVRNLSLAGLAGLAAGVGLALLRRAADVSVRDAGTLAECAAAPVLARVPFDADARDNPLIVGAAAKSGRAEALRQLRTNLRFVDAQEPARVIAVTSAQAAEGKSSVSCNLAIALAEAGWQVILLDADLRRPSVADYLGLEGRVGLTDVLIGEVDVEEAVQPWGDRSLLVLPAGGIPPNPSELLGSKSMADLLLALRQSADIVIIDTPPVLSVTDGVVAGVQADGVLLIAAQGRTSRDQVAASAEAVRAVGARVLGCVLNMAKARTDAYGYQPYRSVAAPAHGPATRAHADRSRARTVRARFAETEYVEPVAPDGEFSRVER